MQMYCLLYFCEFTKLSQLECGYLMLSAKE